MVKENTANRYSTLEKSQLSRKNGAGILQKLPLIHVLITSIRYPPGRQVQTHEDETLLQPVSDA